jgi:branched-subunit amino acid ABC-type transport system permease component
LGGWVIFALNMYMLGAYLALTVVRNLPSSPIQFILMLLVAPVCLALLGGIFEICILRRIYRSAHVFQLLVTFALVLILGEFVKIPWGSQSYDVLVPGFQALWYSMVTFLFIEIPCRAPVAIGLWLPSPHPMGHDGQPRRLTPRYGG